MSAHPGTLTLRRLASGEALAEVQQHVAACELCRATLAGFATEQQQFEQAISFDRFAAGVERAARTQRRPRTAGISQVALALAAAVVVLAGVQLVLTRVEPPGESPSRIKGGPTVQLIVAGAGPQREASARPEVPEALGPGERVRVGIGATSWRYAIVVSIDDGGVVTPIYLENGRSLALGAGREAQWLPESLEFTGKGLERVVVVLSAAPLTLDQVAGHLKLAFQDARGDLTKVGSLPLPGEQFHRTFLKP